MIKVTQISRISQIGPLTGKGMGWIIVSPTDIADSAEIVSALQRSENSHTDLRDLTDKSFDWQRNRLDNSKSRRTEGAARAV